MLHPDNFKVDNVSIGNLDILKNLESLEVLKSSNLEARKGKFFTTPKIPGCSRFQDVKYFQGLVSSSIFQESMFQTWLPIGTREIILWFRMVPQSGAHAAVWFSTSFYRLILTGSSNLSVKAQRGLSPFLSHSCCYCYLRGDYYCYCHSYCTHIWILQPCNLEISVARYL